MGSDAEIQILQPDGWPRPKGYANGMSARGRVVFVAGQVGWNPVTEKVESDDFGAQAARALQNVVAVLRAGGAEPRHVVRMTWFINDKAGYFAAQREIGAAYRELFGKHFPTMSVIVVSGFIEEGAKVEIEATAVVPE